MFEALRGLDGWVTAFRRDSSPTRAAAPFVEQYELEPGHTIVKVNPVAAATRRDTWALPEGARPAAQPAVRPRLRVDWVRALHTPAVLGWPERAGRWAGLSKWECGIHEREAAGVR